METGMNLVMGKHVVMARLFMRQRLKYAVMILSTINKLVIIAVQISILT